MNFSQKVLVPSLIAGVIVAISSEISLAALIFSGDLSRFLGAGIGLMLFRSFAIGIAVAITTSVPGMVGLPQDTPAAILALVAAGIAASMRNSEPRAVYATLVAAISLTSLLTAVFFLLLGWFKASGFVRYIPYPVVGGFLAGTGWVLSLGAMNVMTGIPLGLTTLSQILSLNKLIIWLPGILFAFCHRPCIH